MGTESLRSIPNIALQALEQGLDTPSLYILAGFSDNDSEFEIIHYYGTALHELGIELPDKRNAAIQLGLSIADEIFDNKRSVIEGVMEIKNIAIDAYPFYKETKHYCYDSIGFEKVYGLLDQISDLKDAGSTQWQVNKTNKELEIEYALKLMDELKQWYSLMKAPIA